MRYIVKGMLVIPATDTLNEYSTEEGVMGLKVTYKWGTATYIPGTGNSMIKIVRVYEGYIAVAAKGKFYKTGTHEEIISIEKFIEEYALLCRVLVIGIKEVMLGCY